LPARSKKPIAPRKAGLAADLDQKVKLLRKQLSLANEALSVVMDLVGLKPGVDDKPKTSPAPRAARATKAKPGPKPKAKPGPKPRADKARPGPKPKAKPGATPKAKPGPKPKVKPAPGRRTSAALIRDLRIKAGLSQKALAEKLNASQNTVSQLETGKLKTSVDMAIKLGRILGTQFQNLMG
jgi:DNA-binding XRE family transcriptional regulator